MKLGMIVRVNSISEPTPPFGDAASGNVQRSNFPITQSFHVNDNDSFYSLPISTLVSHHHVIYSERQTTIRTSFRQGRGDSIDIARCGSCAGFCGSQQLIAQQNQYRQWPLQSDPLIVSGVVI
jgi:hypothetical protein